MRQPEFGDCCAVIWASGCAVRVEGLEFGGGLEVVAEVGLDVGEAAGDVAFGVLEDSGDVFEGPAGVFAEGEHGEVLPLACVFVGVVVVDEFPEDVGAGAGEDDLEVFADDGHGWPAAGTTLM